MSLKTALEAAGGGGCRGLWLCAGLRLMDLGVDVILSGTF